MLSLKGQEVAEKMLEHANKTLTNAIDEEDVIVIKVKEIVSAATANLAIVNSGVKELQKLCG